MTSKKLRKYLAYYQKTLREEPDNIEARLRLAAIFRDMGREAHAVEEYVTASKLLAREGLPLEAIAACKAVLEMEPQHTETQLFLARLFARVPDAAGGTARIARPVEPEPAPARIGGGDAADAKTSKSSARAAQPITLSKPKQTRPPEKSPHEVETAVSNSGLVELPDEEPTAVSNSGLVELPDEEPTAVSNSGLIDGLAEAEKDDEPLEKTRQAAATDLPDLDELRVTEEREETQQLGTVSRRENNASPYEDARSTVEMEAADRESVLRAMAGPRNNQTELRTTIDVDEGDIVAEEILAPPAPARSDSEDADRDRRQTSPLGTDMPRRAERVETEYGLPSVHKADGQRASIQQDGPITTEIEGADDDAWQETFEVGVFDMESLRLDRESTGDWDDLSFLDELDEPDTSEVAAAMSSTGESSLLSVNRSDLPEIPLFSQLEPSLFMQLLRYMELKEVSAGERLVGPGRTERSLFVIVRGTVVVTRALDDGSTVELARMGEGEFFGEFALLTGRSHGSATVSAHTDMALLEVRQDVLDLIAEDHPEIWDVLWDFYYARMLNNLLASSTIFRSLTDEQRRALAEKFSLEEVPADELLLGQGDHDDDLYLICHGEVRVERNAGAGLAQEIDTLREGEFVGLISSAEEEPVVANLRATCDTTLLVLPGAEFRRVMQENPLIERQVRQVVRERKAIAGRYTSGVTSYAELGIAPHADSTD
jgi:CRP-like cAMP-binding protein